METYGNRPRLSKVPATPKSLTASLISSSCRGFPWGKIFRARVQRCGILRKVGCNALGVLHCFLHSVVSQVAIGALGQALGCKAPQHQPSVFRVFVVCFCCLSHHFGTVLQKQGRNQGTHLSVNASAGT